ncbi:two pore domain potassium channel family protein [Roseovarius faecimaris]|uniref:Two pore domain potassium channel family protein n=1 Tax=Roseovarius faecimaris TaxID=2494550 RepID=A0A6I6IMT7_9RHOB|nr:potassium channel family protein [Roseovarius faecimaris]QGX98430.1 two pore domain potassium channel family protein [Roseovarius faecimaris]
MRDSKVLSIFIALVFIIFGGTVFFHIVEGWSWIDSYFFTVVTLSTVGYGELVPATTLGKIATTVFIFVGLGVFALAIQLFAHMHVKKREKHAEWLLNHMRHAPPPPEEQADS